MTQQPKLTEEYVHSVIDDAFEKLRRIGERYTGGYLTRDEWFVRMLDCYNDAYSTLFTDNRLELRLGEKSYNQFVRDHEEYYQNHEISHGSDHAAWLYDLSEGEHEAASPDQEYFLYFMDRFSLSPDFFEPPESMAVPVRRQIHQYRTDCVYGIDFRCVDDGGLLSDDAPVGKTFTLRNDIGLRAVLTVSEDRRHTDRKGMDFDEVVYSTGDGMQVLMADFLAEGAIEGYTAGERGEHPEVLIRTGNRGEKNICWLAYWSSPEDEKAYRDFPLWHEYFLWCTDRRIRQERLLHRLFMTLSS